MSKSFFPAGLGRMAVAVCSLSVASASTYTFDNLAPADSLLIGVPAGYGGFQWQNIFYVNPQSIPLFNPSGYINGVVSGPNVAYSGYADWSPSVRSVASGTFQLNAAYLTAAWSDGVTVQALGFNLGNQIYNKSFIVNATAPILAQFDFQGVDRVEFHYSGGTTHPGYNGFGPIFVMDNLSVGVVPEPTTPILSGLGAALMIVWRVRAGDKRSRTRDQAT